MSSSGLITQNFKFMTGLNNIPKLSDSTEPAIDYSTCYTLPFSEVYNEDCIEVMKRYPDKYFDLAVVDPPYGLGEKLTERGGEYKNSPFAVLYKQSTKWDILPTNEYWSELFRVSKNQIIFGANYFLDFLPSTRGFICWDKQQAMPTMSACELVWTSFDKPAKIMKKSSMDLERFHPTQKPIYIYDFVFDYSKVEAGARILDTHLGSGSSRISANKNKLNFVGCEIDKEYFNKQNKRYADFISQTRLF
jgi:site-specific DNA-methyltransferase (adenine-specific)